MAREEDLGRERAVGGAIEIHLPVPEEAPHLIEIVHGRRRGVLREVGPLHQHVAAGEDRVERKDVIEPRAVPPERAGQRIRPARAADVDEHDVPPRPHRIAGQPGGIRRRRRPGTALQEEQRVRRPVAPLRRQKHDLQSDLPPRAGLAVLEHLVGPAERLDVPFRQGAGVKLPLPRRRGLRLGRGGGAGGGVRRRTARAGTATSAGASGNLPGWGLDVRRSGKSRVSILGVLPALCRRGRH